MKHQPQFQLYKAVFWVLLEICSPAWIRSPVVLSLPCSLCPFPTPAQTPTYQIIPQVPAKIWAGCCPGELHLFPFFTMTEFFNWSRILRSIIGMDSPFVEHFSGEQADPSSLFSGFGPGEARRRFRKLGRAPFQLLHRPAQLVPGQGSAKPQPSLRNSSCPCLSWMLPRENVRLPHFPAQQCCPGSPS